MGETGNTAKAPKKSFWKGLKAEYKKIIWPDKATLQKQTAAVISGAVALGLTHTRDRVRLCQKRIGM